jgi:hypothetical protein
MEMQNCWKPIEVIVPARLTASQVLNHIQAQIRISATEAGEFVQQIQLGVGQPHGDGWWKWTASYLPGPPAAFPENQQP